MKFAKEKKTDEFDRLNDSIAIA